MIKWLFCFLCTAAIATANQRDKCLAYIMHNTDHLIETTYFCVTENDLTSQELIALLQDLESSISNNLKTLTELRRDDPEYSELINNEIERTHTNLYKLINNANFSHAALVTIIHQDSCPFSSRLVLSYLTNVAPSLTKEDSDYYHYLLSTTATPSLCIHHPEPFTRFLLLCGQSVSLDVSGEKKEDGSSELSASASYEYESTNDNGNTTSVNVGVSGSVNNEGETSAKATVGIKRSF